MSEPNNSINIGFGKLILFGEHFVVYQRPALVGALEAYTSCKVSLGPENEWSCGLVVIDRRPAVPGYKVSWIWFLHGACGWVSTGDVHMGDVFVGVMLLRCCSRWGMWMCWYF